MQKNQALAAELAVKVDAQPRECYRNSVLALVVHYALHQTGTYVEGHIWIMDGELLIEHGWLVIDGAIVDPTLDDIPAEHYLPVFQYTMAEVKKRFRRGNLPTPLFAQASDTLREMWEHEREVLAAQIAERTEP